MKWNEFKKQEREESLESADFIDRMEQEVDIISRIIKERKAQGLTQEELAEKCGLKQAAIARIENLNGSPRMDTLIKICVALNLKVSVTDKNERSLERKGMWVMGPGTWNSGFHMQTKRKVQQDSCWGMDAKEA